MERSFSALLASPGSSLVPAAARAPITGPPRATPGLHGHVPLSLGKRETAALSGTTSLQSVPHMVHGDTHAIANKKNSDAQVPQLLTHAVGDKLKVVITNMESPSEIMVQKVENSMMIQDLHMKLSQHCSKVAAPQNFNPAIDPFCCSQFSEDKQWYRAKILACASEECISVGYIDFGNSEVVTLRSIRPITPDLLALPMQAIPCTLAGVQPVGESWSKDCLLALRECILNKVLQIEILGMHDDKALVAMVDAESDPKFDIAELLISAGYAAPSTVQTKSVQQAVEVPTTQPQQVSEPLVWTQAEPPSNNQKVAAQVCLVDDPGNFYCRFSKPADAEKFKELEAELKLHCEGEKSPFVPKVGEPCAAMSPLPSFPVGWKTVGLPLNMTFKPEIAAVVNPSLFYLVGPTPDVEKFENMMTKLSFYSTLSQAMPPVVKTGPAVGAACCAQFNMDNKWYRGIVLEVGENQAKVLCADRIYTETLPLSRILPIPVELLELPFKITRCTLTGNEHFPAEWPEDFPLLFESSLQSCVFAKVVSFNGYTNELSVTVMDVNVRRDLSGMIVEALQLESGPDLTATSCVPVTTTAAPANSPPPKLPTEVQTRQENGPVSVKMPSLTKKSEPTEPKVEENGGCMTSKAEDPVKNMLKQINDVPDKESTQALDDQTIFNLLSSLDKKVDHLEQLAEFQLSLINQLVGQTK